MSSLLTLWDYHTGTAITLVGSAMLRTSLHAPLEKGTRKFVWKSKNLKSSLMKSAWQTHGVIMPFSNWATSQAKNVRGDPLHILICKGLYGHVLGSILHYACYIEGPGKRAIKKPADRLAILFSQIQIEYSKQECKNRLTNLRMSMFTDPQKPWAKYSQLDCKGGEARHLLPAFIPVIQRLFEDTMEECEQHMILVATSLEKLVKVWDDAGTFLTSPQYQKGLKLAGDFLTSYAWLNQWSLEKDRMSFHIVPKHHSFIHLVWNSKFLNPRIQWCFKAKDFVGQVSRLTHSVSMGVSSTRLSLKVAPKYRILVRLFLTRSMQQEIGD